MHSRRLAKIASAVQEQVSTTVLFELRDPRVKNVTVTGVEVSPDVRTAKVYVSVLGDEKEQKLCLHGLESARGFLQKRIADRIETRFTPVLTFVLDQGVKKSIAASRVIREALSETAAADEPHATDEPGDDAGDASASDATGTDDDM
jgi:ribosome-binding factor A